MSRQGFDTNAVTADPWRTQTVRISRVTNETPGVRTYDMEISDPSVRTLEYQPGQFNMLYVPGVGEAAISISGHTPEGHLQHTVRQVGAVTNALASLGAGSTLGLRGPFGTPWPMDPDRLNHETPKHLIIVAGGIGLAPLRAMIELGKAGKTNFDTIDVLIGARSPDDLLYRQEYALWQSAGIGVQTTVDRGGPGWSGQVGVVTLLLDRLPIPRPSDVVLMTCGPEIMMRYVVQTAKHRGVSESSVWVTLERNMNCAIGLCGHCQLGPEFVCRTGPVFRYDRVASWMRVHEL